MSRRTPGAKPVPNPSIRRRPDGRRSLEYGRWSTIKERCFNKNDKDYPDYGGRGITVCPRWRDSFDAFYEDLGPVPAPGFKLDRIDNDKGYLCGRCPSCLAAGEPLNVRWVTHSVNMRNTRKTVMLTHRGVTMPLRDWADLKGIPPRVLYTRVFTLGWDADRALTEPVRRLATPHHPGRRAPGKAPRRGRRKP